MAETVTIFPVSVSASEIFGAGVSYATSTVVDAVDDAVEEAFASVDVAVDVPDEVAVD